MTSALIITPLIEGSISFLLRHSATQAGPFGCSLVNTRLSPLPLPTVKVGQIPGGGGGGLTEKGKRIYISRFYILRATDTGSFHCIAFVVHCVKAYLSWLVVRTVNFDTHTRSECVYIRYGDCDDFVGKKVYL